jgi:hypothetical protein
VVWRAGRCEQCNRLHEAWQRSHDAVIRVYNVAVSQQNDNRNRDAVNRCPALARRKTFLSSMGSEDQTGATAVKRLAIRKILGTKTVREITLK